MLGRPIVGMASNNEEPRRISALGVLQTKITLGLLALYRHDYDVHSPVELATGFSIV